MDQYTVKIVYKDKDMKEVGEQVFELENYTQMLKADMLRLIMDVEDAFFDMQGKTEKKEWSDEAGKAFSKIRHRILDSANAVERLPKNLYRNGKPCLNMTSGEWVAQVINKATGK